MTTLQKIREIALGLILLASAVMMLIDPSDGYTFLIFLISIYLVLTGIGKLIYYFQMTRFMVGGRITLYTGIIMFDFGIFTNTLTDVPSFYVLSYLILMHALSGLVEILRVLEARRYGASSWRLKLAHGLIDIIMAVACIVFIRHYKVAVLIYSLGLIYSAVMRIISSCRRTALIYIR